MHATLEATPDRMTSDRTPPLARQKSVGRTAGRLVVLALFFTAVGAAIAVLVSWGCALLLDPMDGKFQQAQGTNNEDAWSLASWTRPGATYTVAEREGGGSWRR